MEVLTGKVPRAQRSALLTAARAGKVPVLVATSLADEGLDLGASFICGIGDGIELEPEPAPLPALDRLGSPTPGPAAVGPSVALGAPPPGGRRRASALLSLKPL